MDLSVDASSDAMTSAVGGEAKKTLVSPSTRDRKNSSVPAVGGATASRNFYTSSQEYSQAPDDDVRLTVEEVDDPVDEAPAMSWWSMKQEAIRQARSTKNSYWIKRGDWDQRDNVWDPELDSFGKLVTWHSGYTPEPSDHEGGASGSKGSCQKRATSAPPCYPGGVVMTSLPPGQWDRRGAHISLLFGRWHRRRVFISLPPGRDCITKEWRAQPFTDSGSKNAPAVGGVARRGRGGRRMI